ncbi:MAG: arabinosyltransferase C-terminal domain-containing protein, partial [Actinomycetota bacterium]|nr:arabinosyltransferase C-terminal domain-containing protein [Actinomycetota bacterium]
RRAGRRPSGLTPDRAVLVTALVVGIPLLLAVFVVAPLRQHPGASVASMNLDALTGPACGLAGNVRVLMDADPVSPGDTAVRALVEPRPITDLTAGRPVFADQVSAALWPCVNQIEIADGIAEVPEVRLRAADGLEESIGDNSTFPDNGGTLVQLDRTAEFVELPSALAPPGVPTLGWGHVERVVPDHPARLVDVRVEHVRRWGWERLPGLSSVEYTGRVYIG